MNEQELIDQCKKQNSKAQKILYDKYSSLMLGMCMRYVYERSEAEDILQEGFLKIFTKITEFKGKGSFESWMRRIIINTAITHYHKNTKYNKYHYDIDEVHETKFKNVTFKRFRVYYRRIIKNNQ